MVEVDELKRGHGAMMQAVMQQLHGLQEAGAAQEEDVHVHMNMRRKAEVNLCPSS